MAQKISKKEEILQRLDREGKIDRKDQLSDQHVVHEMNEDLKEIRRDYQVKERESQIASSNVILTS
jgi:hypothetical protein